MWKHGYIYGCACLNSGTPHCSCFPYTFSILFQWLLWTNSLVDWVLRLLAPIFRKFVTIYNANYLQYMEGFKIIFISETLLNSRHKNLSSYQHFLLWVLNETQTHQINQGMNFSSKISVPPFQQWHQHGSIQKSRSYSLYYSLLHSQHSVYYAPCDFK